MKTQSGEKWKPVRSQLLLWTFVMTVVTISVGWLLARNGGYDETLLFRHRWLGVAFGVTMAICTVLGRRIGWDIAYRTTLALGAVLMVAGAHFGGSMTHGKGFLIKNLHPKTPRVAAVLTTPLEEDDEGSGDEGSSDEGSSDEGADEGEEKITYARDLAPIFKKSCVRCHGVEKQKAKLRLDSLEFLLKGSENGVVAIAGQPNKSPLYALTILPEDDEDVMPSKGDLLTKIQTEIIRKWILTSSELQEGAKKIQPQKGATLVPRPTELDALAKGLAQPNAKALATLKKLGVSVRPISSNGALLDIDFGSVEGDVTVEHVRALKDVVAHVAWLDLSRKKLKGFDPTLLASMAHLRRLHLEFTGTSNNTVLALSACKELRYLNLTGVRINDEALKGLTGLLKLESVYLWKSGVTKAGIKTLKAARPALKVVSGL